MVRSEIISKLSNRIDQKLKKSDLEKILEIFLNVIVSGIKQNRSTELRNFGRFSVKKINKHSGNNCNVIVIGEGAILLSMGKKLRRKEIKLHNIFYNSLEIPVIGKI